MSHNLLLFLSQLSYGPKTPYPRKQAPKITGLAFMNVLVRNDSNDSNYKFAKYFFSVHL